MLQIINLKKYFKNIKAVDDISFTVEKGDIFGLLGPNGAGKSTAISMIATLLTPDGGRILYNGGDIAQNPRPLRQNLGLVPQEIALYPGLSGLENLKFWGRAYGLSGAALSRRIEYVSEIIGINERLKHRVKKYSGGMKRRLNIGAALLHEPKLIIMDEPTVGIDPQSRSHILDTVQRLAENGATVIYTSHYMEEVELLCNRLCIMDNGRIIASGTKDEIVKSVGALSELELKLSKRDERLFTAVAAAKSVVKATSDGSVISVIANDAEKASREILALAGKSSAGIVSFEIKRISLETVFLNLTGRALRD